MATGWPEGLRERWRAAPVELRRAVVYVSLLLLVVGGARLVVRHESGLRRQRAGEVRALCRAIREAHASGREVPAGPLRRRDLRDFLTTDGIDRAEGVYVDPWGTPYRLREGDPLRRPRVAGGGSLLPAFLLEDPASLDWILAIGLLLVVSVYSVKWCVRAPRGSPRHVAVGAGLVALPVSSLLVVATLKGLREVDLSLRGLREWETPALQAPVWASAAALILLSSFAVLLVVRLRRRRVSSSPSAPRNADGGAS